MYIMRDYKDLAIDESYWAIDLPSRKEMKKVLKEHTEYGQHEWRCKRAGKSNTGNRQSDQRRRNIPDYVV